MPATMNGICALSLCSTLGILMIILGCALPNYQNKITEKQNWHPLLVLITYVLSPIPNLIAKRSGDGMGSGVGADVALFCTTALVISGYGIPFVLWHNGKVNCDHLHNVTAYTPYGAEQHWQGDAWSLDAKHNNKRCIFIEAGAAWLTVCGNTIIFLCILFYHTHFSDDDGFSPL